MYVLSEQQIDFILNDIKLRGVEIEDLQLNLLDHVCCIIECELESGGDFEKFYQQTISRFFKTELKEIEEETILLLTFKNYYAMKKIMIRTGAISVAMLIIGSFLKIMHWPGAGALLTLGTFFCSLFFLPLAAIFKIKEVSTKKEKLIVALGTLVVVLFCNFIVFKILHWPGANILLGSSIALAAFVFIPIYFFTGIRNPETKVNTIISSVLLVMAVVMQFTLINTRPVEQELKIKMNTYLLSEELLATMKDLPKDSASLIAESNKLAADISSACEKIKYLIIENTMGTLILPKEFQKKGYVLDEAILGPDFSENGKGLKLLSDLKAAVLNYNASQENKIPLEQSILNIDADKIGRYNNLSVLSNLTQIQLCLANAQRN